MAVFEVYRTARTAKDCENYPRCTRGKPDIFEATYEPAEDAS